MRAGGSCGGEAKGGLGHHVDDGASLGVVVAVAEASEAGTSLGHQLGGYVLLLWTSLRWVIAIATSVANRKRDIPSSVPQFVGLGRRTGGQRRLQARRRERDLTQARARGIKDGVADGRGD